MANKVAVVIPIYQNNLSDLEFIALRQCQKVLNSYPIIIVKPNDLTLSREINETIIATTENFDNSFFKGIVGYNRLMLNEGFYSRFLAYDYILIYQLDAFVFRDELTEWVKKGFDYVGAPWIRAKDFSNLFKYLKSKPQYFIYRLFNIHVNGHPHRRQFYNRVGNGGLSLRNVKKFHDLCIAKKAKIDQYVGHTEHEFNEDAFWSIEVNRFKKILKILGYKTGLKFSIELEPKCAMEINKQQLPFGCHDWDNYRDFWRPIFRQYGYEI